jgi:hypothetical protein
MCFPLVLLTNIRLVLKGSSERERERERERKRERENEREEK